MLTKQYLEQHPELWQQVLFPHKLYGWIRTFWEYAETTEYPFFLWNDVIYTTSLGSTATENDLKPFTYITPSRVKRPLQ